MVSYGNVCADDTALGQEGNMFRLATLMRLFVGALLFFVLGLNTSSAQVAPRIAFTPDSVTLMPGQTQSVSVALSDPIICPNGVTCDVKVNLEPLREDPRVSISVSELVWVPAEWDQTRTFQISMIGSETPLFEKIFVLPSQSNSELYSQFAPTFTVVAGVAAVAAVPSLSAWAVFMLAIMLTLIVRYRFSRGN